VVLAIAWTSTHPAHQPLP